MERKKIFIGSSSLVAIAAICTISLMNRTTFTALNSNKNVAKQIATTTKVAQEPIGEETTSEIKVSETTVKTTDILVTPEVSAAAIEKNKFKKKASIETKKWLDARNFDHETGTTITAEKLDLIRSQIAKMPKNKNMAMSENGPDNIGGRTRAILIDKTNNDRIWAGGVSGSLFVSTNGASTWERVDSYVAAGGSPNISSMTQTNNGVIYVASGSADESWNGNGVHYSSDYGVTWTQVPGTGSLSVINEVVSSSASGDNTIWMATSSGVKKWTLGDVSLTSVSVGTGNCSVIQISKDGSILVAGIGGSNQTYVSQDGGATWVGKGGNGAGQVPTGGTRIEYAISPTKNSSNNYSIYATRTSLNLNGMNVSHDNGSTWSQFIGASGSFSNLNIYNDQGWYNTVVSVAPNDPEKIFIGGLDVWKWKQTQSVPPAGGFEQLSNWSDSPWTSHYNHADNHEMKWDANNSLYVGNDGGISITNDYGENWYPSNRGYNATQFYGIAFDRDGKVMGGAQDNGTLYNDYSLSTLGEYKEVMGGDGFECEISFYNPKVMFGSIYYNSIKRSGDAGAIFLPANGSYFAPDFPSNYSQAGDETGNFHPFHTEFVMSEYYDLNSLDSVIYIPRKDYAINSVLRIPSLATGDTIDYTTPVALYYDDTLEYNPALTISDVSVVNQINGQDIHLGNFTYTPFVSASGLNPPIVGDSLMVDFPSGADTVVVASLGTYQHYFAQNSSTLEVYDLGDDTVAYNIAWDEITVQDPYQSWFVMYVNANGGELWATRDAMRLSVLEPNWRKIACGIGTYNYGNIDIEFSKDLNQCYVSAGTGVWRIDGLGSAYGSESNFNTKVGYGNLIDAGAFVIGTTYQIVTVGSTNFVGIGAASNAVGTVFVATGAGIGSGDAFIAPTATSKTKITTSSYEGIAVNPNDPTDLILFAGFSGSNKRCDNANTATNDASLNDVPLGSITSPSVACYDGIIDRDNADIIAVATSEGVFVTENGGTSWADISTGFEGTPVYEIRQSWRTWDEGNRRPGEIYAGTHGRGIWTSASYLSVDENNNNSNISETLKDNMIMYPNPTSDNTTLVFNLNEVSDVTVKIYTISGSLVKTITKKNLDGGKQSLSLDSAEMPKGTYIVKMNAGQQNETAKFIKM